MLPRPRPCFYKMDTNKESVAVKEGGRVLVLVDVQNDFHPGGSLAVPNADQDSKRIASLILRSMESGHRSIDRIICTMDSHNTRESNRPRKILTRIAVNDFAISLFTFILFLLFLFFSAYCKSWLLDIWRGILFNKRQHGSSKSFYRYYIRGCEEEKVDTKA